MGKLSRRLVGVLALILLVACQPLNELNSRRFSTFEEARAIGLPAIEKKYGKEFSMIRDSFTDSSPKIYMMYMSTKEEPVCEFGMRLTESGGLSDNYADCAYEPEVKEIYKEKFKDKSYILSYTTSFGSGKYTGVYDTSKPLEEYMKDMNSNVRIEITIADNTPNEEVYEIARECVALSRIANLDLTISLKVDGYYIYMDSLDSEQEMLERNYTNERIQEQLSREDYNNGLLNKTTE